MSEWHVIDLDGDPTPGDPGGTRELAGRVLAQAQLAERNTDRLASIAAGDGSLRMEGDYAPKFREELGELPGELAKLARAYRGVGDALNGFAGSLEEAKTRSGRALRDGRDAYDRYQGALTELRALLPAGHEAVASSGLGLEGIGLQAAMIGLDEGTKAQVEIVARRARSADQDRDLARRLADDAARLRGDAEERAAGAIDRALDGIRDKSFFEKLWDTISAPFRSWDAFVELCKGVALVAGIVALFISGPIGWALVAAALVAGAVVFADSLYKFANGEASFEDVALAALGLIPGTAGALQRLGPKLLAMARNLPSVGRNAVTALRNLRGAIPSIRNGITNLRQSAVALGKRTVRSDPVDVATGEMVLQQLDVDLLGTELPGVLPLVLARTHVSSYRVGRWFGPSWTSTLDQRLEVDGGGAFYASPDGMLLAYPAPTVDTPVLPQEGPQLPLTRTEDGGYRLDDPDTGHTLHFRPTGLESGTVLPLAAVTNRTGARIDLDYDPDGTITGLRHSGGPHIAVETTGGLITALRLHHAGPHGGDQELVRYGYDTAGRLTEIVNSSGQPLRFAYDPHGRMTRWQDRNGTWYRYTYDPHGRCVHTSGSDGCLDGDFTYDPEGGVTVATDSLGHATTFHLDEGFRVVREVDPLGHTTTTEWDRYDRPLAVTDPLGRTTSYTHDQDGNLTQITRPDGSRATTTYNELRQPLTATGPDGAVWRHAYDQRGNPTTVTDPTGATTTYAYDERGHLSAVTDALGNTHQIHTDTAGLPIALTDPLGATTRYRRDPFGRVTTVTDPLGATTRYGWTVEGKLASRTLPDGATDQWTYDAEGNLVEHTDPMGQVTRTENTHFDLPAARTGPDGARLAFAYDTELQLVAVTNPNGLIWSYEYDPAGNLVRETDYNHRALTYTYDAAGQLVQRTNGAGQTTRHTYDPLGNLVEQHSGDTVTTFEHDPAGRVVRATNPDTDVTFERDPLGRVLAETCNHRTTTFAYDLLGRRIRRRTPSGAESAWEYDPASQPVALHTAGHTVRFRYDPAGREAERQLGSAAVLAQTWDDNSRMRSQDLATGPPGPGSVRRRAYDHRADGYVTSVDDQLTGGRRLELDAVGQVTGVRGDGWTERYAYDVAGNVVDGAWPAAAEPGDGDARGGREYSGTLLRRAGGITYEHDDQGRVVRQRRQRAGGASWRYTWDAEDRLTCVIADDGRRWRYRYDGFGRRVAKEALAPDGATVAERTTFTWEGVTLAEETHEPAGPGVAGSPTIVWDWKPGTFEPVSQTERTVSGDAPPDEVDERFYAIVADQVGTPTELVDQAGRVVWRATTTLWGRPSTPSPRGETACPLRFPGQYHDDETGLHYNHFRYYDPDTARYRSADPLGLDGGPDPHRYVPNPLGWVDPLGLTACNQTFATRNDALAAARARAGLTAEQRPTKTWTVGGNERVWIRNDPHGRHFRSDHIVSQDKGTHGRYYQYETDNGTRLVVEHTHDPKSKPHFHAGQPKGNPDQHIDMQGKRYVQVGAKHHFYYTPR